MNRWYKVPYWIKKEYIKTDESNRGLSTKTINSEVYEHFLLLR